MASHPDIYISTHTGLYRGSVDGGIANIQSVGPAGLTREYVSQIAFHPSEPNVLFTAAAGVPPRDWRRKEGADSKFFRSDDQGHSWKTLGGGLPEHITAAPRATTSLPEKPGSFFVGMNDGSIWMTTDFGESFNQVATGLTPIYGMSVSRN